MVETGCFQKCAHHGDFLTTAEKFLNHHAYRVHLSEVHGGPQPNGITKPQGKEPQTTQVERSYTTLSANRGSLSHAQESKFILIKS